MATWEKKELAKIRKGLPPDGIEQLADQFKLATGTVQNIMLGSQKNDNVVLAAIELVKQRQEEIARAKEAIAEL